MSLLKIARIGHPVLRTPALPVEDPTAAALRGFVADMIETMEDAGGVGLAAPQVHVLQRVLIFKVPASRVTEIPGDEPAELSVLINPVIEPEDDSVNLDWEGCLSIPGLRGAVPRYTRLRYGGYGLDGRWVERSAAGFHARVVQHECDHLDGVVYLERMPDHRLLGFLEEAARFPVDLAGYAAEHAL